MREGVVHCSTTFAYVVDITVEIVLSAVVAVVAFVVDVGMV